MTNYARVLFENNLFLSDNPDYIPTYLQSNLQETNATEMSIEGGSQMSIEMADVSGMIRD